MFAKMDHIQKLAGYNGPHTLAKGSTNQECMIL